MGKISAKPHVRHGVYELQREKHIIGDTVAVGFKHNWNVSLSGNIDPAPDNRDGLRDGFGVDCADQADRSGTHVLGQTQ